VIDAIDMAATGDDWMGVYYAIDKDDDILFSSTDREEVFDFVKKSNKVVRVEKDNVQTYLTKDFDWKVDGSTTTQTEIVWEREHTKKYDFDESLQERNLTKAERHNRDMERIFARKQAQDEKMAKFLKDHGISDEEVEELKKNTGLSKDGLGNKIRELGLWDEFWSMKEACKDMKESFVGRDLIERVIEYAQDRVNDGEDKERAIAEEIDSALIYNSDILDLAEHFGVIDYDELRNSIYEPLYDEVYRGVKDPEIDEVEEEEEFEYDDDFID
jgi:hypothetical protein